MKKYITLGLLTLVLAASGAIGAKALAQSSAMPSVGTSPMIVNINPNGSVLLRGFVEATTTPDTLIVKSWGGSWNVKVSPSTEVLSMNRALADLRTGDFVGVLGTITSDGSFVIDATIIRKWGQKTDHDQDSIADDQDADDDNDGISDPQDAKPYDHDNDDVADDQDDDDDNDGVSDGKDSKRYDHDDDGLSDARDLDDDNDGIADGGDLKPRDHDNDGEDDKDDDDDEDEDDEDEDEDEDEDDEDEEEDDDDDEDDSEDDD